jgi:hypothetical protein
MPVFGFPDNAPAYGCPQSSLSVARKFGAGMKEDTLLRSVCSMVEQLGHADDVRDSHRDAISLPSYAKYSCKLIS